MQTETGQMQQALFFQWLRFSIGVLDEEPSCSAEDWEYLYEEARRQSLLGVLFRGIERSRGCKPDRTLLLRWYAASERIREANRRANRAAVKLSAFFARQGFRTCVLKGQGNVLNYPDAFIRTSGDVDIWVDGGVRRVLALARQYVPDGEICYHHIDFRPVDGVESEVHFRPSFMNNLVYNRRLQRWFESMVEEQFCHEVELPEGVGGLCVPTDAFNRIYQLVHISNHFFHEGIGLRQLMDYYFLLQRGFTEEERQRDECLLRRFGLLKVAQAVMYVLRETMGLPAERMLVPADERTGRVLLREVLLSGNFGHFDSRLAHSKGALAKNVERLQRDARLMWHFPSECLWEPVFRWYHFFWRLMH